jgi:hypothetical protein
MNYLKHQLLNGWHLARWIRLALGGIMLVQAIDTGEFFFGAIAVFLLYQAFTNTGCCGFTGACPVPPAKTKANDTPEEPHSK